MAYLCKYCQKPFSRSDNRDRHEKQSCRLAYQTEDQPEQQENMLPYSLPPSPSVDENEENENIDESEDIGDNDNIHEDEEEEQDPWEVLRTEVKLDLSQKYSKQVEQFQEKGFSQTVAEAKAFNRLLPYFRVKLRRLYLKSLKWYDRLKRDPVHEEIIKTLHRLMKEEGMDREEAMEAAVDRRKFLLNRVFRRRSVPEEEEAETSEEEDGENDEDEATIENETDTDNQDDEVDSDDDEEMKEGEGANKQGWL